MNQSYKNPSPPSSSPSTFPATVSSSPSSPPDEISLFLQQFLLRTSSSSSSTSHAGKQQHCSFLSSSPSIFSELTCNFRAFTTDNNHHFYYGGGNGNGVRDEISAVDSSEVVNHSGSYLRPTENDNENDEYFDCESEEGLEAALEEELPSKRNNRCSSSSSAKRSRAAEVHNLSEKRRRSRINEKMKALQNLIPNSNKTDKASMLDEAIEYLKQLQLQVQMLTMRNGLSLHPMSLPGSLQYLQLSHMRMNFGEENSSLPTDQERPTQILFNLPDQRTPSNHQLTAGIEKINAENPFELQPSIRTHSFNMSESTKEICGEDVLQYRQVAMNQSNTTPFEFEMGSMAEAELQNGVPVDRGIPAALTLEGLHQVKH